MKKFLPYILILIILISAVPQVHAVSDCWDPNTAETIPATTQADCTAQGGLWGQQTTGTSGCISPQVPARNPDDSLKTDANGNLVCVDAPSSYHFLQPLTNPDTNAPLTDFNSGITPANPNPLGSYLNLMIKIIIGLCAVLAMVMIFLGGIEYMTSEVISSKEHGKERIRNAILGLLVALGSYAILNTINPTLLSTNINLPDVTLTDKTIVGGESTTSFSTAGTTALQAIGVTCSGNDLSAIAQTFVGKVTYSKVDGVKNTITGGKLNTDCSGFVDQVYACAGLNDPGGNTAGIFSGAETVTNISADGTTVNGQTLKVGDLLGWIPSSDPGGNGHVVMYIGNGQIIEDTPSGVTGARPLGTIYQGRIKSIRRAGGPSSF